MTKRICFIITKSEVGGAQKWVKEQIDFLSKNGFECFICTNKDGWLVQNSKVTSFHLNKNIEKRTSLAYLFSLRRFLEVNKIDLIVGNSANGGIYSRLVACLCDAKVIYVSHGWSSVYNGGKLAFLFNRIEKILSLISSRILCVSENDYKTAKELLKISEKKLSVITNKIYLVNNVQNGKSLVGVENEVVKVLFLGRLAAPKCPTLLIDALKNNPKYEVHIVGDGPDYSNIQEKITTEQINNVKLKGEIKDFNAFQDYDMFCLISKSEGLPLSAIEAMSSGLPLLISNVGGCSELIRDNGYLTDNTTNDILKGCQYIHHNLEKFALNSVSLFNDEYNLELNYQKYIDLYETANCVLIGASGFVGSRLIEISQNKFELSNLDKNQSDKFSDITVIGDVREQDFLNSHLSDKDVVVLLAAEHRDDVSPLTLYYDVNVQGTKNVLEAMDKNGVKNIIFTSSVAVYGLNKNNPNEEHPADPFNHYGKSKWQAEEVLREWYKKDPENRSLTIIRPTVIFGENNRGNVYNLLKQIASGKFLMVGKGNNKKSMAYVGNIAAFLKYQLENIMPSYQVFNYIDKPDFSMNELASQVENSLNKHIPSTHFPYWLGMLGGIGFDVLSFITRKKFSVSSVRVKKFCATTQFDANKAHSNGFKAPYTLSEGLDNTLQYEFGKNKK